MRKCFRDFVTNGGQFRKRVLPSLRCVCRYHHDSLPVILVLIPKEPEKIGDNAGASCVPKGSETKIKPLQVLWPWQCCQPLQKQRPFLWWYLLYHNVGWALPHEGVDWSRHKADMVTHELSGVECTGPTYRRNSLPLFPGASGTTNTAHSVGLHRKSRTSAGAEVLVNTCTECTGEQRAHPNNAPPQMSLYMGNLEYTGANYHRQTYRPLVRFRTWT